VAARDREADIYYGRRNQSNASPSLC
jgi:hypothetical protein